ncbi:prolipoprotein diacylglyceryl transferase [Roseovarius sp. MMSF_3281]|uniref:prolipoprotein diacylglyceryl transferase n=1 Tax=Roseovarius sp. MMSF_3281 TaxID=3046694 RepID=UPI00273FEAD0|nr:prolipoprotein diacylglyceryl transferase [Roseovarius sp. MMSF_3281]
MQAVIPFPDISPEIFSISLFGMEFALRWYALAYIVGIVLGWRLVVMAVRRGHLWRGGEAPLSVRDIEDLLTWVILGVILGGRLGFVLFYQPGYYLQNPVEIVKVWQGGMAFHGGLLGVMLACLGFAWSRGIRFLSLADLLCMAAPVGLLLGRIANFINAELWGRPTDAPWGVVFPTAAAQDCPGVEGPCARHPSQLYEAGLEGLLLGAVILWLVWRHRALWMPGLVAGVFFIGYGLSRFVVEFFRQADAQFITPDNPMGYVVHLGNWGLSMGQLLSLPMVALGLFLLLIARRHET